MVDIFNYFSIRGAMLKGVAAEWILQIGVQK